MEGGEGLAMLGLAIIYGIATLFLLLSVGFALSYWKRQKTWKLLIALVCISGLASVYFMLDNQDINSYLEFIFIAAFAVIVLLVDAGMEHSPNIWLKYLLLGICFNFIFSIVLNTLIERQAEDAIFRTILLLFFYINPVAVFIIWRYAKRLAAQKASAGEMYIKGILLVFTCTSATTALYITDVLIRNYLGRKSQFISADFVTLICSFIKKYLSMAAYTGLLIFFIRRRALKIDSAEGVD